MGKLFTVLHRPQRAWEQEEVIRLVDNLSAAATMKPAEFPNYVILIGHHTRQDIADALGEEEPLWDVTKANGHQDPALPFLPPGQIT